MDYLPQHKKVDEEATAANTGKTKEHGKEEAKQHGHIRTDDVVDYVDFAAVQAGTAYFEKKYEKAADKVVRLIGKEETKDHDQEKKNKGIVYQF